MSNATITKFFKSRLFKVIIGILLILIAIHVLVAVIKPILWLVINVFFVNHDSFSFSDVVKDESVVVLADQNNEYTITIDGKNTKNAVLEKNSTGEKFVLDSKTGSLVLILEYDDNTQSKSDNGELLMSSYFVYDEEEGHITVEFEIIYDEDALSIFDIKDSDLEKRFSNDENGYFYLVENTEIVFYRSGKEAIVISSP